MYCKNCKNVLSLDMVVFEKMLLLRDFFCFNILKADSKGEVGMRIKYSIFILVVLFIFSSVLGAEEVKSLGDESLNTINLNDALITAIENSPILMTSKMDTVTAKYRLSAARTAYNPVIGAGAAFTQSGPKRSYEVNGEEVQLSPTSQGTVSGNLAWTIDISGQIGRSVKIQSEAYDASKYAFETSLADLIMNVQTAYFACLQAKDNLNTARSALQTSEDNLKNISIEVEHGTRAGFDQTRQEYDVTVRKNAVVTALAAYGQAVNNFNFVLGYTNDPLAVPDNVNVDNINFNLTSDLISKALESRSEIKQLEKLSEASKLAISYEKGENYPSLQLTGGVVGNLVSQEITGDYSWQAMANLIVPIWSGGIVKERVNQAKSEYEKSLYTVEAQKQNVATSVRNAVLDLLSSKELIVATKNGVDLSKENYDIAYTRYEQQLGTYLDVSTALDQLVRAENDYTSARYSHAMSVFNMERQTGTQSDIDNFMKLVWEDESK